MHKGTYLIAAVLFCTAALAACGASNSASPAPSPDSMATRFSQGSMDDPASQGSMDDPALQGSMDDPASQGSMDDPATQESMDAQAAQGESAYHKITASEAKAMMDQGGVTVVDVRREDEYAAGHIRGSVWLPYYEVKMKGKVLLPKNKNTVIYVYCASGKRSDMVCSLLADMGYTNVYNIGRYGDLI